MTDAISLVRLRPLAGGLVLILWLAGCATPQTAALLRERPGELPPRVELAAVPFFPQEAYQCGPASLAMALNAAGASVTPEALAPQVFLPERQGSLQLEMIAAGRRHGRVAYELAPNLEALLAEVAAGTPVVVLQNLAFNWYPRWHYAVVIGYDLDREEVILRSGPDRRAVMPMKTFERTWERGGYWAMVALRPDRLPRTARQSDYVKAVVALEKSGQVSTARTAYEAALKRWPGDLTALIGLGNTAYAQRDLNGAERAFRRAAKLHPDSPVAFNNLAQVLADQRKYPEAIEMASRAVELAGPHLAASQATLDAILAKSGKTQ